MDELRKRIKKLRLPEEANKEAQRELDRLKKMPPQASEYHVARTYLDWIISLPWHKSTTDRLDIARAETILERGPLRPRQGQAAHPGIPGGAQAEEGHARADPLLRRAARHRQDLARRAPSRARSAGNSSASPSAASATRPRSAATAAPTSARCPAASSRGSARPNPTTPSSCSTRSTSSAWTSAATPAPRCSRSSTRSRTSPSATITSTCRSTSRSVMFITTANVLDTVPPPLRDRMEVLELPGYTLEEKIAIANKYLIPRQKEQNGLKKGGLKFSDPIISRLIANYTREAGAAQPGARNRLALPQAGRRDRPREEAQKTGPHR